MDIDTIRDALLNTPYAKEYKDDYIYVRCPICGDSIKHLDKPHCSIWIREGLPLIYHCWICTNSGIVNKEFLSDLNVLDSDIHSYVTTYNKSNMKGNKINNVFITENKTQNLSIPTIRNKDYKVDYIRNRLGINFTKRMLEYLRCIVSIKDFLNVNNIKANEHYKKLLSVIEEDYVGFLSTDKTYITFRNTNPYSKYRYIKYSIFDGFNLGSPSYTVPNRIDVMDESIDLHIAEGIFDILSVFFNVCECKIDKSIYAAACGSGYKNLIRMFLRKGLLTNLNVNIYSDSDKDIYWYQNIYDMKPWFKNINIYYNDDKHQKDFGVRKEDITIRKLVI